MSRLTTRLRQVAKEQATQDQLILAATIAGSGGGGGPSISWTDVVMSIPNSAIWKEQTFSGPVSPTNVVEVMLSATNDSDENCPELLDLISLYATAGSGQFVVTASFATPTRGDIKLKYRVS
jgi:hypothetical protein